MKTPVSLGRAKVTINGLTEVARALRTIKARAIPEVRLTML